MKPIQVMLELVLAWITVISIYMFRDNYKLIILGGGCIMISWFYLIARQYKWSSAGPCSDEALTFLSMMWLIGSIVGILVMKVGGLAWPDVGLFWVAGSSIICFLTNLRMTYLFFNP